MNLASSLRLTALAAFSLFLFSCSEEPVVTPPGSTSNAFVQVRLTDLPGPYQEVNVDVIEVSIHSDSAGWQILDMPAPGVYNLLDYTAGADTLIASDSLPAGKISQIRLKLGANNSVMVDSVLYDLDTPSGQTSGIKLNIHDDLAPGVSYGIVLDFDAAQSVHQTGGGQYKLKPVIRAYFEEAGGAIKGDLDPDSEAGAVYAIAGVDTFGTFADSTGAFLIGGLAAGSYDLLIEPVSFGDTTLTGIGVSSGMVTDVGLITLFP